MAAIVRCTASEMRSPAARVLSICAFAGSSLSLVEIRDHGAPTGPVEHVCDGIRSSVHRLRRSHVDTAPIRGRGPQPDPRLRDLFADAPVDYRDGTAAGAGERAGTLSKQSQRLQMSPSDWPHPNSIDVFSEAALYDGDWAVEGAPGTNAPPQLAAVLLGGAGIPAWIQG